MVKVKITLGLMLNGINRGGERGPAPGPEMGGREARANISCPKVVRIRIGARASRDAEVVR